MIILRNKNFSEELPSPQEQAKSSQELLIEQMKTQRALMQTQRQRERLQAEETQSRMKSLRQAQKIEKDKDEEQQKSNIRVKKLESDEGAKNVGLYKTKTRAVPPVPMKV